MVKKQLKAILRSPDVERVLESGMFDVDFYAAQAGRTFRNDSAAVSHYLKSGAKAGFSPHPLFDMEYYTAQYPELGESDQNPLMHFLEHGTRDKCSPHPLFDAEYYLLENNDVREAGVNPLQHYLQHGWSEGRPPNASFDLDFYRSQAKLKPGEEPLTHYARFGSDGDGPATNRVLDSSADAESYWAGSFPANADPSRIAVLTSHDATRTGAPLIILHIARVLAEEHNYTLYILIHEGGPLSEDFEKFGKVLHFWHVKERMPLNSATLRMILTATLDGRDCFAICNSAQSVHYMDQMRLLGIPYIALVHEFSEHYEDGIMDRIMEYANAVVYPADLVKQSGIKKTGIESDSLRIIPQGIFNEDFPEGDRDEALQAVRTELELDDDTFIFLGMGAVDPRKGCDTFVNVAKKFTLQRPDANCVFVWIGQFNQADDTYEYWLKQDVYSAGLSDRVFFIGERESVDAYFLAADAFLMVSRLDPFPCVVQEAMAARLPVVCFEGVVGSTDALGDTAGIAVSYLDITAYAQAMGRLYDDPELRTTMGEFGSAIIKEHYQFGTYVTRLLDLVDEVILSKKK